MFELQNAIREETERLDLEREMLRKCVYQFPDVCKAIFEAGGKILM